MKKKIYIAFLAVGCSFATYSTTINVEFKKDITTSPKIYLNEIIGSSSSVIDSSNIVGNKALFEEKMYPSGFYEIYSTQKSRFEILINNQNQINVHINSDPFQNDLSFSDQENTELWKYKYFSRRLQKDLSAYTKAKEVSGATTFDVKIDSLNRYKDTYKADFISSTQGLLVSDMVSASAQDLMNDNGLEYRKQHFFDKVNFNNPALVRSSVLNNIIVEYLQVHTNHDENGFKESIDQILLLAKANNTVYNHCLSSIMNLFNKVGPEIIFQYVVENHLLNGGCADELNNSELTALAMGYAQVMPGNKVPPIQLKGIDNNSYGLSELVKASENTIVFFWSSHCNFCSQSVPILNDLMGDLNEKSQLITLSLDTDPEDWTEGYKTKFKGGKHYCDFKGWKSEAVKKLKVHKTPTFYVLDSNAIILHKSSDAEDLKGFFLNNLTTVRK